MSDDEKDVEMQEVKVAVEEVDEAEGPGAEEEPKETKKKKKKKPKSSKEQDEEKAKQAEEEHHRSSFHRAETVTAASGDAGMKSLRAHYLDRKSLIDVNSRKKEKPFGGKLSHVCTLCFRPRRAHAV